jgi:glycerol-3-phosphate acyltransferase PlsX
MLGQELRKTIQAQVGYVLAKRAFTDFRRRLDYSEYGGAPLLGINGITIVCHGRSNANAIKNGIRVASEFCRHNVNAAIEREFRQRGFSAAKNAQG